jgi:hypothetical protein
MRLSSVAGLSSAFFIFCGTTRAATPLLALHLDNSPNGVAGEVPTAVAGLAYEAGVKGAAGIFGAATQVKFPRSGNFNEKEGTVSFWIKPTWAGNDQNNDVFLSAGTGGGMIFFRDHQYMRMIVNRYVNETDCIADITNWTSGAWHNVVYTWSDTAKTLKVFIDGSLAGQRAISSALPAISAPDLWVGSDGGSTSANSSIDEFYIFGVALNDHDIASLYLSGLTIESLTAQPTPLSMPQTWVQRATVTGVTNVGSIQIPNNQLTWSSSNPAIAVAHADGLISALQPGTAKISASLGAKSASMDVTVKAPARPPTVDAVDPFLRVLPPQALYDVPVVIVRYIPTQDGINVDQSIADYAGTVDSLKGYISQQEIETKFMLQEGSRYHGYKDSNAIPSLGYRVVKIITFYEELPPDVNPAHSAGPGHFYPDYAQILKRINGPYFVDTLGVKEFWVWGYHHGSIVPVESDMSSPTTGDVSNSARFSDDLPVYSRTYTLYNYNFTRSSSEAVHDHGHQLENLYAYIATKQDGNSDLFWKLWDGRASDGSKIVGRCGNTHMPPNTTVDYDYYNLTQVLSDCEDWRPDNTGAKVLVNANTWGNHSYAWPYGRVPGDIIQHNYYVYWMENMCGFGASIPIGLGTMTNWWSLTGDWDTCAKQANSNWGLHANTLSAINVVLRGATYNAGDTATLLVTLAGPAPAGGGQVQLSQVSAGGLASIPAILTIPAGQRTSSTVITLLHPGRVRLSASAGGATVANEILCGPSILSSVSLPAPSMKGGSSAYATVRLLHAAGIGGVHLQIRSSSALAGVPPSLTVPFGASSARFLVSTSTTGSPVQVQISATTAGQDAKIYTLTLQP